VGRGERNARNEDRRPVVDPYFGLTGGPSGWGPEGAAALPGYSQPSPIDPTGYTLSDPELDRRLEEVIPDDVTAPLGGPRVGRLALSSYGAARVGPVPGGALGEAGAVWDRPDDGGIPVGEYLAPQHAQRPAPLEYGRDLGVIGGHALAGLPHGLGEVPRDSQGPSVGSGFGRDDWGDARIGGSTEYQGRDPRRPVLSDREVYDDLYSAGREFGSARGREDDGLPLSEGGDRPDVRWQRSRRRLSDDPGYS
jgi:hypothetical protein